MSRRKNLAVHHPPVPATAPLVACTPAKPPATDPQSPLLQVLHPLVLPPQNPRVTQRHPPLSRHLGHLHPTLQSRHQLLPVICPRIAQAVCLRILHRVLPPTAPAVCLQILLQVLPVIHQAPSRAASHLYLHQSHPLMALLLIPRHHPQRGPLVHPLLRPAPAHPAPHLRAHLRLQPKLHLMLTVLMEGK